MQQVSPIQRDTMTMRGVSAGLRIPFNGTMMLMMAMMLWIAMMRVNLPLLPQVEAFAMHPQQQPPPHHPQTLPPQTAAAAPPHDTMCVSRRQTLSSGVSLSTAILTTTLTTPSLFFPTTASAASKETTLSETELTSLIHNAFENIRNELQAPSGGVQTLQQFIRNQDYPAILEYTKTYDQILRKGKMKPVQALLLQQQQQQERSKEQQTQLKDQMTTLSNAITFDLIGLNRNARQSQINAEQCAYYLQALREDLQQFLNLEPPQLQ